MPDLIVQKYGGTSVCDAERIQNVARRVVESKRQGNRIVVVVSALAGTTDNLVKMAYDISPAPNEREMDMLLATGEQISMALLALSVHKLGEKAISFTGPQVGILTDGSHTKARILDINTNRIREALKDDNIVIIAGFQGKTVNEEITTLGRGGSDLTAVALAKALRAKQCEIYTDVDGIYTADPRVVTDAKRIDVVSYDEILELAALGAKVMQSRSVEVGKKFNIPIWVKSSLSEDSKGTLITKETKSMEEAMVRGVALDEGEAKVTMFRIPDKPGVAARIFKILADDKINVDMIIQNKTETKTTDLSFTVRKVDLSRTLNSVNKASKAVQAGHTVCDEKIAKVSVVGVGMRSHSGVASRMFDALAKKKINIEMISTSEIKISVVVEAGKGKEAVKVLHQTFRLGKS